MKRTIIFFALALLTVSMLTAKNAGNNGNLGVGLVLGEPTGITWRYLMSDAHSLDGAIALAPYDRFRINVDYLWNSQPFENKDLSLYYGVGGALGFGGPNYVVYSGNRVFYVNNSPFGFGGRVPVGLSYIIPRAPVELLVEIAPILVLSPPTGVFFNAGIGGRFYF